MKRRTYLKATTSASFIAIAGCTQQKQKEVKKYTFSKQNTEKTPTEPEITEVSTKSLTVEGTVTVSDGCETIKISSPPEFKENTVETTISTEKMDNQEVCTQALEEIGYKLHLDYTGGAPEQLNITHKGPEGKTHTLKIDEELVIDE
jgi:hypothetical protein